MAKANAGVITKLLKANGFERVEWSKNNTIAHAWGIGGFDTEQDAYYGVCLSWWFAGRYRNLTEDDLVIINKHLSEMSAVLVNAGYVVTLKDGYNPYLKVEKPE